MTDHTKALLTSYFRVFLGCLATAYLAVAGSRLPLDLALDDWKKIANSLLGALLVTGINYLRSGETRFGRGAQDMGMGGEDTLDLPDGQVQVKPGDVPAVVPIGDLTGERREYTPMQTDNRPKDGDPDVTLPQAAEFSGEMK